MCTPLVVVADGWPLVVEGVKPSSKGVPGGVPCSRMSWSMSMPVALVEVSAWSQWGCGVLLWRGVLCSMLLVFAVSGIGRRGLTSLRFVEKLPGIFLVGMKGFRVLEQEYSP